MGEDFYKGKTFKPKIGELIRPATPVKEKIEKILVVTIINHPYIIDRVIEDFTKLEFSSSAMIKLKEEILRIYDTYHMAGEIEKGNEEISGLRKNISDIERDIEIHAKFLGKNGASEDEILSEWNSFFEKYLSEPMITEDLHKASISLQSTFSESDWQRLKALKNSTLLAKKNRGKQ